VNNKRFLQVYVALLFLMMFLYGASMQAIGTLITRIIEHYGIRMAQAGLLSSFNSAGNFFAIFIITIFVGRIHKMILLGIILFFYAVSLCLVSIAPPFSIVLMCFSLIGLFGATVDTIVNSMLADLMPDNVNRSMSLLHGFFGLGGFCGPIFMDRIAGALNWMQVYFFVSMFFFIFILIYVSYVKLKWNLLGVCISAEKQVRVGFSDVIKFFNKRRHLLLWLAMFFYGGNQSTLVIWLKRYVETHLNAPVWGAYALSAVWLGTAISRLVISPAINASSPVKICIGNLITAVALAAGLLAGSAHGIAAAALAAGLSSGLTIPLIIAMGCEWNPERTAYGTMMPFMALFLAYFLFPPLSGLIGDFIGIPWGVAVGAASALMTAVIAVVLNRCLKSENA